MSTPGRKRKRELADEIVGRLMRRHSIAIVLFHQAVADYDLGRIVRVLKREEASGGAQAREPPFTAPNDEGREAELEQERRAPLLAARIHSPSPTTRSSPIPRGVSTQPPRD